MSVRQQIEKRNCVNATKASKGRAYRLYFNQVIGFGCICVKRDFRPKEVHITRR
jgi:hypothetical protein